MDACEKLYRTASFREINLKAISQETSLSRPSIYNYFQTKEEIFLGLLKREYAKWASDLREMVDAHAAMTAAAYADALAETLAKRELLLRIQSTDLSELEENSRLSFLTAFKEVMAQVTGIVDESLAKFFPDMTAGDRVDFAYAFFPFIYGVYPYAHPTDKQKKAMDEAGMPYQERTVKELVAGCVRKLL